ncbi:hypothetical protein PV327_005540 [Microctonus hyperodae]|uniref:Uncharacterized protein n=1 Tax=Microctonus hyperodae TaxID=165561 RepID=A0AA39KZN0_MICHY|nr:hypothetical protein PV327_005540 [Microctonus hyperodae]
MESAFCEREQIAGFRLVDWPSDTRADEACQPFMKLLRLGKSICVGGSGDDGGVEPMLKLRLPLSKEGSSNPLRPLYMRVAFQRGV